MKRRQRPTKQYLAPPRPDGMVILANMLIPEEHVRIYYQLKMERPIQPSEYWRNDPSYFWSRK